MHLERKVRSCLPTTCFSPWYLSMICMWLISTPSKDEERNGGTSFTGESKRLHPLDAPGLRFYPPVVAPPMGPGPEYDAWLAQLPSIGSANHFHGTCDRCCFHPKGRCHNGYNCHLDLMSWWFFMSNCWMNYVNHVSLDSEEIWKPLTTGKMFCLIVPCASCLNWTPRPALPLWPREAKAQEQEEERWQDQLDGPWAWCPFHGLPASHAAWTYGATDATTTGLGGLPIASLSARSLGTSRPSRSSCLPSIWVSWRTLGAPTGFPALGRGPIDPAPSLGRLCVPLGRREPLPPRHVGPISRAWSLPSSHRDSEPPPATHRRDVPHEPGSWVCQTSFGACYVTWCSSILSPGLGCHPRLSGGDCDRSGDVIHAVWMLSCLHCNGLSTPQGYIGPQLHPLYLDPTISDPSQHVRRENLSHRESAMAGGALSERVTEKLDREERCIDGRSMPKYLKWPPQRSQVRNGIAQVLPYFLFCIFPTSSWNLSGPSKVTAHPWPATGRLCQKGRQPRARHFDPPGDGASNTARLQARSSWVNRGMPFVACLRVKKLKGTRIISHNYP